MKIKDKTICVTGAAGFIGSSLCRELISHGGSVIALDNYKMGRKENLDGIKNKIEIVEADVMNPESLREPLSKSQIVYHLAAIDDRNTCQKNFKLAYDTNITGTFNVLSNCSSSNLERFIFMSSNMVYGEALYLPIDEKHPTECSETYAITKIIGENLCKAYNFTQKIPFTIVRNFNTFGPRQNPSSLIPSLIIEGLTKNKIEVWASSVLRDFQYVDDCANALVNIAETDSTKNEILNLGTGKGVTTGEITDMICKILNTDWIDLKKQMPVGSKSVCDTRKIRALTDLNPRLSLEDGLRNTIEYYKSLI